MISARRRASWMVTGAVVAPILLVAGEADAQAPQAVGSIPSQTAPAAVVQSPEADAGLQDIVVTAQLRRQDVQKAPLAIDVVSTATIANAGITNLPNLSRLVPAIQIAQAAGATPIYFIRGVGSLSGNSLTDPAVSITYDGVPLARQYQGNGQFYDLDRVEVLRGPQGTLYGRNATGGVINLTPAAPVIGETSFKGSISGGNYSTINSDGAINIALGAQAALRASFMTADHNGYLNDGEQDEKERSGRIQLLLKPEDSIFRLKLGLDFHHQGGLGGGYALVDQSTFNGYPAGTGKITADDRVGYLSARGQEYYAARGRSTPTDPVLPGYDNRFYGMNAHVDLDLGFGTLSIIPAYRHADLNYYAINSFSLNVIEKDDQYSLETRLTSKDSGKLRWIVGAFALGDHVSDIGNFDNFNGTGNRQNFKADTNSKAVFGDATYSLTDRIRLIGGIRYTDDHKTAFGLQTNLARTGGFIPLDGDAHFKRTNYRAGAQLDIAPRVMAYATVATGFHSGGFYFSNIVQPTDRNSYAPESILAYTVGLKSKLFDNKVLLDVELFRWQLKNQQVSLFTLDGTGQIIFPTLNAGRSTNQGVQVDGQYQATRTTMVGAQVQYLSAIFNQLSYTQAIPTQPGIACAVTGVAPAVHVNCSGLRSVQAPKWSVNLSGDQTVPLASGADFVFGARAHYQSRTLVGFNYLPDDYQKKVWTEDLTLTYNPDRKHWSIGAFVNNLSDQTIKSNATHNGNVEAYQLRPPRTYGGRFSVNF